MGLKRAIDKTMLRLNQAGWFKKMVPDALVKMPAGEGNVVFLTFDDGPDPGTTPLILDMLGKYECTASFFVTGQQASKFPGLLGEIAAAGHCIGNHSFSHPRWILGRTHLLREIRKTNELIESVIGEKVIFYRPPHGRIFPGQAKLVAQMGMHVVLWDIFIPDYLPGFPAAEIRTRVSRHAKNGAIVLLHDRSRNAEETLKALPGILTDLREKGFVCRALAPAGKVPKREQAIGRSVETADTGNGRQQMPT